MTINTVSDSELEEAYVELHRYRGEIPRMPMFPPVRELALAECNQILVSVAGELDRRDTRAGLSPGSTRSFLLLDH